MTESFSEIAKSGFQTWKSNISITVAYIISNAVSVLLMIPVCAAIIAKFMAFGGVSEDLVAFAANSTDQEIIAALTESFISFASENLLFLIVVGLIWFIAAILVGAFLQAGMTAMVRDAVGTGTCSLNTLISGGRKYFGVTLGALIVMYLLLLVICIIYGVILGVFSVLMFSAPSGGLGAAAALLFGAVVFIASLLLCFLVYPLYFIIYAPILDDVGVGQGVTNAFSFIREYKGDVFRLSGLFVVIAFFCSILSIVPLVSVITNLLLAFVVAPAMHTIAVGLYMKRTGLIGSASAPVSEADDANEWGDPF